MKWLIWTCAAAIFPYSFAYEQDAPSNETFAVLANLPSCAVSCLLTTAASSTCSLSDVKCLCTNGPSISSLELCVKSSCTIKEGLVFTNFTRVEFCGAEIRDRRSEFNALVITATVCAIIAIVLRLLARCIGNHKFWYDDWLLIAVLVVEIPISYVYYKGLSGNGLGMDIWTVSAKKITDLLHVFWLAQLVYFTLVGLCKSAFLFFYLRIFPNPAFRRVVWITIAFNVAFSLTFLMMAIFQCRPLNLAWKAWDGEHPGKCLNFNAMCWSNAGISILLDFWMLALPISQIKLLQLKTRKKIGVGAMLCVGTLVTVISIIRLHFLVQLNDGSNFTWDFFGLMGLSTVEIDVSVICACLPQIRQIQRQLLARMFGKSFETKTTEYFKSTRNDHATAASNATRGIDTARNEDHWNEGHWNEGGTIHLKTARTQVTDDRGSSIIKLVHVQSGRQALRSPRDDETLPPSPGRDVERKPKTFLWDSDRDGSMG